MVVVVVVVMVVVIVVVVVVVVLLLLLLLNTQLFTLVFFSSSTCGFRHRFVSPLTSNRPLLFHRCGSQVTGVISRLQLSVTRSLTLMGAFP